MGLKEKFKAMKVVRNKDSGTPLQRYQKSFFHAIDGFIYSLFYEHNIIVMVIATIITIIFGLLFKISSGEWLFCIIVIAMIFAAELINSSIEALVDLVTPEKHPLAKIAKDTASGAVLVLCISAFVGALIIFVPKFLGLF